MDEGQKPPFVGSPRKTHGNLDSCSAALYLVGMETSQSLDPVAMPAALMTEIQHAAEEEHRSTNEVIQDAVEQYLEHRRWQRLVLSHEVQLLLANALLDPPEPTPALRRAAQHHRDLLGSE
jgi:uncharacterized protein (DUF1778 family)